MRIFDASKSWPPEEKFALISQARKSSRAICGCIAEGWAKRRYPAHFVSKLTDADAECRETTTWLDFARDCRYIDDATHRELHDDFDHVSAALVKMISNAES
jgi:four helix bundle protein